MQRNFAAFLVLSFGVLIGWMALVTWLRPMGLLEVTVVEGVDPTGIKVIATSGQTKTAIDLSPAVTKEGEAARKPVLHQLPVGEYELSLEGDAAAGLMLSQPIARFTKEDLTEEIELVKRPAPKQPAVAIKAPEPDVPSDKPAVTPAANPAANPAPPVAQAAKVAPERVAIGSVDPDGAFRQLVIFDNRGAAVERIELASHRYHDLEDETGYFGHLSPTDLPKGAGAVVGVVGGGTPASTAGLKVGDVIVKLAGQDVLEAANVETILAATKPGDEIEIAILRDGKPQTLRSTLVRHPMQIVRPELENRQHRKVSPEARNRGAEDPLSYLLTLDRLGKESISDDELEIEGIDLRTAAWKITHRDEQSVEFQHTLDKFHLRVTKRYTLAKLENRDHDQVDAKAYHVTLKVTIEQTGGEEQRIAYRLDGPTGLPTEGWWYSRLGMRDYYVGLEQDGKASFYPTQCVAIAKRPNENDGIRPDASPIAYAGINAQYFTAAVLPQHDEPLKTRPIVVGDVMKAHENLTNVTCRMTTEPRTLKSGEKIEHEYQLFAGPKRPDLLGEYDLRSTIDYGMWMWAWIARLLQGVLHTFYALVGNYGLAIVMLTVMVRLAMFPLSRKQVLGAMKMQELQPEMKRINEQYKKDPEARNKALQQLFRKHNYSPLSGCLPIFIQLPIFIGLYNSLSVDIELRQQPLIAGLAWCSNLAAPDMLHDWSTWMPNFVMNGGLFGMLPPAMGPYLNVLPILTVTLMIIQQKLFTPPPTNEQMELQQKIMKYMMVVMCLLFYKVAAGLCLYFICSTSWGLAERKLMPKPVPAEGDSGSVTAVTSTRPATNGSATNAKNKKRQKGR